MVAWLGALKSVVERRKREGSREGGVGGGKDKERERGTSGGLADGVKGMSIK